MVPYYRIQSPLSRTSEESSTRFIGALRAELGEELIQLELDDYLQSDFALLYVATGGSENAFLSFSKELNGKMCYILTSGDSNSLAASMEILSYLNAHGGRGRILHGSIPSIAEEIRTLCKAHAALVRLRGKRLGCIGEPSDWLIASDCDADALSETIGVALVRIPMDELLSEAALQTYEPNELTGLFERSDFDKDEIRKALYVYGAFRRLTDRYNLCGVSVRCFDLLDTLHTTGCLGLSVLNSLGVYAGCEGDMPSLLSMAVLGSLTGEDTFMCNPSRFDTDIGVGTFAHCTLPVTMPARFSLDTHFESGIGVAVRGEFDTGPCTLFKCAGDLSRYVAMEGQILETPFSPLLCRTQVRVSIPDFSYFLSDPIGNHHILCKGTHKKDIQAFFELLRANS